MEHIEEVVAEPADMQTRTCDQCGITSSVIVKRDAETDPDNWWEEWTCPNSACEWEHQDRVGPPDEWDEADRQRDLASEVDL